MLYESSVVYASFSFIVALAPREGCLFYQHKDATSLQDASGEVRKDTDIEKVACWQLLGLAIYETGLYMLSSHLENGMKLNVLKLLSIFFNSPHPSDLPAILTC